MTDTAQELGRYQWHPQLRESWGYERLYFWRIHFPTYERLRYLENIKDVMRRVGVHAYAVYELYGGFDILLRVWLPTTQRAFESTFHEVFGNDPSIVMEGFSVTEAVTHWPWAVKECDPIVPLPDDLVRNRLSNDEIERLNGGSDDDLARQYEGMGLLAATDHLPGVKFAILISASRHSMTLSESTRVQDALVEILRKAAPDLFSEKSLYKGIGFASYLLLGRTSALHAIESDLTQPINALVARPETGARTTTFISSTEKLLAFLETMRLPHEPPPKRKVSAWLNEDESHRFEVKGSAFTDLNGWLLDPSFEGPPPRNNIPIDSLCKAVVGLLNAEGGAVVVGALEIKRYGNSPRVEKMLKVGDYIIWGIRSDMPNYDWDTYARNLREALIRRIAPDPSNFIEIERDGVGRRPLCVISVRAPVRTRSSARWFYHYEEGKASGTPRFWVREGNRTREKLGPEIDDYKSEKTRRVVDG